MSTTSFEITFVEIEMPEGIQNRLALLVNGSVVCRTPALRPGKGLATTNPGSACWVLSRNAKAVGRLEQQLRDGSRFLVACKTAAQRKKLAKSVKTLCAYATAQQQAEAKEAWTAIKATSGRKPPAPAKKAEAPVSSEELAAFRAWKERQDKKQG